MVSINPKARMPLHSPYWMEKENHKIPAHPARLLTSARPPLHRLRRVFDDHRRQTHDLHHSSSYLSCFYCNRKTQLWGEEKFWAFLDHASEKRGKNLWHWCFCFCYLYDTGFWKKFLGFLAYLAFSFFYLRDALLSEQE